MPSKLEHAATFLKALNLTVLELEAIRSLTAGMIESHPTPNHPPSLLLSLPAELRNSIYHHTAQTHLKDHLTIKPCPLLLASHQVRAEFTKIAYDPATFKMEIAVAELDVHAMVIRQLEFKPCVNRPLLRAILLGGKGIEILRRPNTNAFLATQLCTQDFVHHRIEQATNEAAEYWHGPQRKVYGVLEMVGDDEDEDEGQAKFLAFTIEVDLIDLMGVREDLRVLLPRRPWENDGTWKRDCVPLYSFPWY